MNDEQKYRFSAIAHREARYWNPLAPEVFEQIIRVLPLGEDDRVLDLACGRGELLARLGEEFTLTGVGVDKAAGLIELARARARASEGRVVFEHSDARDFAKNINNKFTVTVCVGASTMFGSQAQTLDALTELTEPGGLVLFGTMYWRRPPSAAFLELLGVDADWCRDYAGSIALAQAKGLTPLYARVASEDDWDRYEWSYRMAMTQHLHEHPDDPDREAFDARNRGGRDVYLGGGRDCFGFGLFLYRR